MIYRLKTQPDEDDPEEVAARPNLRLVQPVTKAPGRFSVRLSFLHDPGSLLAMAVMAFIFYNQVFKFGWPPSLPNVFSGGLIGLAIVLFAVRREPTAKGNAFDATLAIVGTFSMAF